MAGTYLNPKVIVVIVTVINDSRVEFLKKGTNVNF